MNNLDEGSTIIGEDESEQKGIAGLNELLEQDLKGDDSVDHYIPLQCFMEDDVRKYTPKLKLNHEGEAPAVPDTTLYSPKEGDSTDNNSSTLEAPEKTEKAVPSKTTNGADNLQSSEGNASETDFVSKEVDIADEGTNDIETTGEDDTINKNGLDPAQNEEDGSLVSEEASGLKDESNEEHNAVEQNGEGSSEEETNKESETAVEARASEEVATQLEMESSVSTEALQSEMESSVPKEASQPEMESSVPTEASQPEMESGIPEEASESEMESNVPEEAPQLEMESVEPEEASQLEMESVEPEEAPQLEMESVEAEEASQLEMESVEPEEASPSEVEGSVPEEALEEMETENSVPEEASQSEMESSVPEESEEAGNSQSAQDEDASGAAESIPHDALPPEDEETEFKENTTSADMVNTSDSVPDKPPLSPVFKLSSSSEAKKAKETNKPVIITARIVTNEGEVTTNTTNTCIVLDKNTEHSLKTFRLVKVSPVKKAADNCGVSDITSTEDTPSNTKSAESDEKKHTSDEAKGEETNTEVQSDDAVNVTVSPQTFILTKRVYGNTKKSPGSVQETKRSSTEASSTDKQEDHSNTDEDQDMNVDSGVKVSGKSKVLVGKEVNNTRAKSVLEDKTNVGGSCTEKGHTDLAGVKRKFETISRKSRQEEEDAIKEIKKMKRETLDILKKINGEMKKLKSIFLAGN